MVAAWAYVLTILIPINFVIAKRAIDERRKNKKILLAMWRYSKR